MDLTYENKCYICLDSSNNLVYPCLCKGTNYGVHQECLLKWIETSKKSNCSVCKYEYEYDYVYTNNCTSIKNNFYKNMCIKECSEDGIYTIIVTVSIFLIQFILAPILNYFFNFFNLYVILSFFIFRLLVIIVISKCTTEKISFRLLKYWELLSSFISYICLILNFTIDLNECQLLCNSESKVCNINCEHYKEYSLKYQTNINSLIFQTILIFILFLIDFVITIRKSMYIKVFKEFIE